MHCYNDSRHELLLYSGCRSKQQLESPCFVHGLLRVHLLPCTCLETQQGVVRCRLTGRVGVVLDGGSVAYDVDLLHTAPATSTVASSSSAIPSPYSAVPTDGRWSDAVSSSGMQRSPFTAAPSSLSVSQSLSSTKGTITQPFNTLAVESLLLPTTANGVSSTNRVSTAAARDTACMSSQQSGFTHMQTAAMQPARVSQRGVRLPVAQQVSTLSGSAGDETDVDFDDALQALQELEALEAPAELSRHSTAQGASRLQHISRPQHELCNPGSLGNHTAATHTSGAVEQDFSRQPAASDWTSQSFDRHMPQSTRSNRTVRRLWVPPGTDALPSPAAATPAAAAPVRIMKRPSTASNQNTHADASPGTSNPVLVASQLNSVPPEIIRSSSTAAIPEDPDRLQTAGAASVIRMSPPEVCPTDMKPKWQSHTRQQEVGRGNNCDSVSDNLREGFALEMAVQHLMSKTVGLSEAAAVLALKVSAIATSALGRN